MLRSVLICHRYWYIRKTHSFGHTLQSNPFATKPHERIFCEGEFVVATYNFAPRTTLKYLVRLNTSNTVTIGKVNVSLSKFVGKSSPFTYHPVDSNSSLSITANHATLAEFLQLRFWQKLSCSLKPKVSIYFLTCH